MLRPEAALVRTGRGGYYRAAMERQANPRAEGTAAPGPWGKRLGLLVLLGLLAWHGWMTLSLFGPDHPWERLLDDQPIVSGRHPLHLYHGYLGARSLAERGTLCCYDPAFQAGYPKTPVFDSGSRPAGSALTAREPERRSPSVGRCLQRPGRGGPVALI